MVDRKARDKFAELLRHFIAGRITNEEFDDQVPHSPKDLAIDEILWLAAWPLYDDFKEHTLTEGYRVEVSVCVNFTQETDSKISVRSAILFSKQR